MSWLVAELPGFSAQVNLSAAEIKRLADRIIAKSKETYDAVAAVPLDKVYMQCNNVMPLHFYQQAVLWLGVHFYQQPVLWNATLMSMAWHGFLFPFRAHNLIVNMSRHHVVIAPCLVDTEVPMQIKYNNLNLAGCKLDIHTLCTQKTSPCYCWLHDVFRCRSTSLMQLHRWQN